MLVEILHGSDQNDMNPEAHLEYVYIHIIA